MLPSFVGNVATRLRMLAYPLVLMPVALLLDPRRTGPGYAAVAIATSPWFAASMIRSMRVRERSKDRRVCFVSLAYPAASVSARLVGLFLR